MDQERIGKFIKELREKNNLTQKQFATKYHVTYQAVSKWENGKNMPDTALLKQMSEDFNISLEEILNGEYKEPTNHKSKKHLIIIAVIIIFLFLLLISILILRQPNDNFEFKTLSSNCKNFNISGNIAYNQSKSAIYITNIQYCGGDDTEKYNNIECILYEKNNDSESQISSYKYDKETPIILEEFLQDVTLTVNDYENTCKSYTKDSFYLLIKATSEEEKTTSYKIPLLLEEPCPHN